MVGGEHIMNNLVAGAIAGIISGIVAFIVMALAAMMGAFGPIEPAPITTMLGIHLGVNLIWGIIYGAIFALLYGCIPGKGIKKGFIYGLLLFVICNLRVVTFSLPYGMMLNVVGYSLGIFILPLYGIILGALYKK